jgi:hypothetical protein
LRERKTGIVPAKVAMHFAVSKKQSPKSAMRAPVFRTITKARAIER